MRQGICKVICTDIGRDGMLGGPAIDLYRAMLEEQPGLYLIASGGVGALAHIEQLAQAGVPAVIVGKAIYEGRIPLDGLTRLLLQK